MTCHTGVNDGLVLPVHYRDDDPYICQLGELCEYSGTGDMTHGCPRGCSGAREHYRNDGHPQCEDGNTEGWESGDTEPVRGISAA